MIDTSPPGSWASIIPYCTQIEVSDFDPHASWLERRLATRRAARGERNPHKRGHLTRKINSEAKKCSMEGKFGPVGITRPDTVRAL